MNIIATILVKNDTKKITESFHLRTFVLEYGDNPQYLENIIFELHKDKVSLIDPFKVGDLVTVHFNLKGRKWTNDAGVDKYFNTLQAWKIENAGTSDITPGHDQAQSDADEPDLPF